MDIAICKDVKAPNTNMFKDLKEKICIINKQLGKLSRKEKLEKKKSQMEILELKTITIEMKILLAELHKRLEMTVVKTLCWWSSG